MADPAIYPTQAAYREGVLADAMLGGQVVGTVAHDPDLYDADAARTLISGRLFDAEKLSGAHGGHYVWVPRYGDSRRVEDRGYRVKYVSVYQPPESGVYKLRFYGVGESPALAAASPASTVQAACRSISPDLAELEVKGSTVPAQLVFFHPFRCSLGSTAGQIVSNGGVGLVKVTRDFSQPLAAGEPWCLTAKLPFEDDDELAGVHTCIRLALSDILIPDLYPITAAVPSTERPRVIHLSTLTVPIEPDDIIGYYAPTQWLFEATLVPPSGSTYMLTTVGWNGQATTPVPIPYNADGAAIEAALRQVPLWSQATVSPQGVASRYTIQQRSLYASWALSTSGGYIDGQVNTREYEPLPVSISPYFRLDAEASTLVDPGYGPGETWFIHYRRRAHTRVCPQTYPKLADGSLDQTARPILGDSWIDSTSGPQNDLDQCIPSVFAVAEIAIRYAYAAIAAGSPRGEGDVWAQAGRLQAAVAAGKVVYGRQRRRGSSVPQSSGSWALVGQKGVDYWLPG